MDGLSNGLAIWRNLWSDGEDLARHAHDFITNQLAASRPR
ncbi:MAG: xylose isomerase protein [Sphaerisporangium sp.]|jgi:D-psicose/D-tagatose/L-ribulose 3-epimerase|nr:xylose isomerase protein [Sphaerisporangium sp.]